MSSHASCVSEPVLFLVEHDGLPARLHYDTRDPMAAPEPVPGADVEAHWSSEELRLTLHGPDGRGVTLLLDADDPALCAFVADIYDLVPAGTEHTRLDDQWDRLLLDGGAA